MCFFDPREKKVARGKFVQLPWSEKITKGREKHTKMGGGRKNKCISSGGGKNRERERERERERSFFFGRGERGDC